MNYDPNTPSGRAAAKSWTGQPVEMNNVGLEHFAALVAAAEREACARECDDLARLNRTSDTDSMWQWEECASAIRQRGKAMNYTPEDVAELPKERLNQPNYIIALIKKAVDQAVNAEREACLQIADYCADADMHASMAANAIRARRTQ